MKGLPLNALKKNLSNLAQLAAKSEIIKVSKHNKAYLCLMKSADNFLHYGAKIGHYEIKPVLKSAIEKTQKKSLVEKNFNSPEFLQLLTVRSNFLIVI